MRAELILIITIMALTSFFSALGMPNARGTMEEPRDTLIGGLGERNIAIFRNNAQISPDSAQTGNATRAQILMAHPRTLSCYWSADLRPLSDNEFEQVNYDGFDEYGNRYRGQAFAIQQFARPLNEGGTRTELYVGVEAGSTNRSQVWRSDYPPKPGSWVQVAEDWFDPSETGNAHIDSSAVFKDWLFMGVCNGGGCQVWYTDGTEEEGNSPYLKWQKAVDCGFGSGHYEGDNLVYDN
ncbi:MAG: hypothetical protein JW941_04930, partial [Candidatus Coatesbacteria bacterium]|nr:hypothetical protein [Candidatus Coatesbacteria bacterium]